MLSIPALGEQIATRRKSLKLSQSKLAERAGVSRPTISSLETGRIGELGFSRVTRILSALGMELKLSQANLGRPTLEDLLAENRANSSGRD